MSTCSRRTASGGRGAAPDRRTHWAQAWLATTLSLAVGHEAGTARSRVRSRRCGPITYGHGADMHYVQRMVGHRDLGSTAVDTPWPGAPGRQPAPTPTSGRRSSASAGRQSRCETGTVRDAATASPASENTRTRLLVQLSSSAAMAAFVSPGQPGRTAANSYEYASGRAVAGDDPVNESDPSGLYAYEYFWDLGPMSQLGSPFSAFEFFTQNVHSVFPFSTGQCATFSYVGEPCVFHPGSGTDYLHVSSLGLDSVTLKVDNWCQSPGKGATGVCVSGDTPGSTIRFSVGEGKGECSDSYLGSFDFLDQTGRSTNAGPITNLFVPTFAFYTWHQQARNLAEDLGGDPNDVALLTGPGWSYGLPIGS